MPENTLQLEQRQKMSLQQMQSLELLAYTNQELDYFLTNEYLENPLLDNSQDKQNSMIENLEQHYEKSLTYKEHSARWDEDDCSRENDIPAQQTNELKEFLTSQLNKADFSTSDWQLINYLIECLDEDGFFIYKPEDIAHVSQFSVDRINACLHILKTLEPVGIFAEDISECLKIQLDSQGIHDQELFTIIEHYMPDILNGQIAKVSRALGLSSVKIKSYIHLIGELNPRPILNSLSAKTQYIVPDIIASYDSGQWHVNLNDSWLGDYKYNDYYLKMMHNTKDDELKEYFKIKYERTRFVIQGIEQRRNTIIKVVMAILELQDNYFRGNAPLMPMSLDTIAQKTNFHASTVSRAIKDKYLQYEKTVLLKDLFTSSISHNSLSTESVKNRLLEIIHGENTKKPFSDAKLSQQMEKEGIKVSRRTIAKYRQALGIPKARQRQYLK